MASDWHQSPTEYVNPTLIIVVTLCAELGEQESTQEKENSDGDSPARTLWLQKLQEEADAKKDYHAYKQAWLEANVANENPLNRYMQLERLVD